VPAEASVVERECADFPASFTLAECCHTPKRCARS
jgi:hypothetical protein